MLFAVPGGDDRIGHRQVGQRQQSGITVNIFDVRGGNVPQSAVPEDEVGSIFSGVEIGELGLLRSTGTLRPGTQRFNLVIVGSILLTVQSRRWFGPELVSALECETGNGTQPRRRHGRTGRRRRRLRWDLGKAQFWKRR